MKGTNSSHRKGDNGNVDLTPSNVSAKKWGTNGSGGDATKEQRITSR